MGWDTPKEENRKWTNVLMWRKRESLRFLEIERRIWECKGKENKNNQKRAKADPCKAVQGNNNRTESQRNTNNHRERKRERRTMQIEKERGNIAIERERERKVPLTSTGPARLFVPHSAGRPRLPFTHKNEKEWMNATQNNPDFSLSLSPISLYRRLYSPTLKHHMRLSRSWIDPLWACFSA